jgi:hypothetical protein
MQTCGGRGRVREGVSCRARMALHTRPGRHAAAAGAPHGRPAARLTSAQEQRHRSDRWGLPVRALAATWAGAGHKHGEGVVCGGPHLFPLPPNLDFYVIAHTRGA